MKNWPYTSYFIVGTQRSGTTVTHYCLRGHPAVSALSEELAYSPFFTDSGLSTFTYCPGTKEEQQEGRRYLFDALTGAERNADTEACGVKCAFGHGTQGERFVDVVQKEFPASKIIHVVRRDKVAQYGSRVRAQKTGLYSRDSSKNTIQGPTITLDPYRFISYMLDVHEANYSLRRIQKTHDVLNVEYEQDILNGELRKSDRLFSFVGVEPRNATWLQKRKVSPPPEEYIFNYKELRKIQKKIEKKLSAGHLPRHLRSEYGPPPLKKVYRTGKFWVDHPGYAVYQVGKTIKNIFGTPNDNSS